MKRYVLLADHARRVVKLIPPAALRAAMWAGVLTFAFAQMASAAELFVATNGTGDGSNWASATNSLQGAIDAIADSSANTVWVSNGVYQTGGTNVSGLTNRVYINKSITVRSANNDPINTIIKGAWDPIDGTYGLGPAAVRGVLMTGGWLIGFTVTNGATLALAAGEPFRGGGVNGGTVSNCIITGNSAGYCGGGAYASSLYNCMISGNKSANEGAGARACNLYNCTLSGNTAVGYGGGGQDGKMYNCLVIGNKGGTGGGVGAASVCSLYNCTIVGNQANSGGGVYSHPAYTITLYNCIIYSNNATSSGQNWGGPISFTNSCTTPTNDVWAAGNTTNDPLFIAYGTGYGTDHVAGNYRLRANSPCVNKGTNGSWTTTYSTDLDGRARIRYGTVDMGAYELILSGTILSFH